MKSVIFDIKGTIAHFRRPDTTATQLTYPFITPIAAKGLVGAILGITDFVTKDKVGIQILNPVMTSTQQLSMLGKEVGTVFNRPTTMELLVNPSYRIYYTGDEYVDELVKKLKTNSAVYPTYLGVAFAFTFPKYIGFCEKVKLVTDDVIETNSVVPTCLIKDLLIEENRYYSRAEGFMKDYLGERRFEKSISYIYEKDSQPIKFQLKLEDNNDCVVVDVGGMPICLV